MGLPKLETPVLMATLPVTGTEIEYRPFTVREESLMNIIANDQARDDFELEAAASMAKLIEACVLTKMDTEKLPLLDAEFIFLKIKEASSGEVFKKVFICKNETDGKECGNQIEVEARVDDAELIGIDEMENPLVQISDEISLMLKIPSLETLVKTAKKNHESVEMMNLDLLANNIESVVYGEETYTDFTNDELIEKILMNMQAAQLEKVSSFIQSLPKLKLVKEFTCPKCGFDHKIEVESLINFFA